MTATIIIGALVLCYAVFVIRKRAKQIKAGQYCGCGCSSCEVKCKKKDLNSSD